MVFALDLQIDTEEIDQLFLGCDVSCPDSPCQPIAFKRQKLEETDATQPAQLDFFDENWECNSVHLKSRNSV